MRAAEKHFVIGNEFVRKLHCIFLMPVVTRVNFILVISVTLALKVTKLRSCVCLCVVYDVKVKAQPHPVAYIYHISIFR